MPVGPTYKPHEYIRLTRMSNRKRILVEGSNDKRAFKLLLSELFPGEQYLDVDTAQNLIGFEHHGNREKVEEICRRLDGVPYEHKLVGFVDRESREFERNPLPVDRLGQHKVTGRLVWSRGHSIENYSFDYLTLRQPLRVFSVTDQFDAALSLFESVFESAIRIACAVSFTAEDSLASSFINSLRIFSGAANFETLQFVSDALTLDCKRVRHYLVSQQKLSTERASKVIDILEHQLAQMNVADPTTIRWMCHGHIGLACLWGAYSACVFEVCRRAGYSDASDESRRVLRADETVRFNACVETWTRRIVNDGVDYPSQVFTMLALTSSRSRTVGQDRRS